MICEHEDVYMHMKKKYFAKNCYCNVFVWYAILTNKNVISFTKHFMNLIKIAGKIGNVLTSVEFYHIS